MEDLLNTKIQKESKAPIAFAKFEVKKVKWFKHHSEVDKSAGKHRLFLKYKLPEEGLIMYHSIAFEPNTLHDFKLLGFNNVAGGVELHCGGEKVLHFFYEHVLLRYGEENIINYHSPIQYLEAVGGNYTHIVDKFNKSIRRIVYNRLFVKDALYDYRQSEEL